MGYYCARKIEIETMHRSSYLTCINKTPDYIVGGFYKKVTIQTIITILDFAQGWD
jgi:hypothetical protein